MNVSHSVPLGLILNEALVNSLKYAFPNGREGKITVTFEQTSDEHFVLTSSDNGIGLHPDFNIKQPDSFGFSFIQGLCDEVGGQLEIISYGGTTVRFGFDYIQK